MASTKAKLKRGMKGSNGGKDRWEETETLKHDSKKRRRAEGKSEVLAEEEYISALKHELKNIDERLSTIGWKIGNLQDDAVELIRKRKKILEEIGIDR